MRAFFSLLSCLFALSTLSASAGELKLSAGVSPQTNVFSLVTKPFEKATGIKVVFTNKDPNGHGGDIVFKEVDQGVAQAGASGAVWEDWQKMMREKGYTAKNGDKMHSRVFGRDRIQFMTWPGGPKKLSEDQLKGLLTGKVKNWKEVGGPDQAVTLVIAEGQPSTAKFLEERFLGGESLSKTNIKLIPKSEKVEAMVKAIGKTAGAIGFGPVNLVDKSVNVPETPVVGRPLTMIWIGEPSPELLKYLDFIEKEGPRLGVVQ
jgi:phosphate transport system substrate-binding protein